MTKQIYTADRLTCKYMEELACQYGGSENLKALLEAHLRELEGNEERTIGLQDCLNVDLATGECLTAIGEYVGWPRTHCAAQCTVSFGFTCQGDPCPNHNILGWCSGDWLCGTAENANKDYTFADDELYRSFIKAKILANGAVGTVSDVLLVAQALLGANVCLGRVEGGACELIIPRLLTTEERSIIELIKRILPVSLATDVLILESDGPPFGFSCPGQVCQPAGWCVGGFLNEVNSIC